MRPRRLGHALRTVLTVAAMLLAVCRFLAAEESALTDPGLDGAALALHPPGLNSVVQMAVFEAHRRLESARCRELFSDFRDASGRTLQENLDSIGRTAQNYLEWIWFANADLQSRCAQTDVLAFTVPGSRVVSYCGDHFTRRLGRRGLGPLATVLIHEELHSLGLGENPPTSDEITRRVEWRCSS